ncbi:ankyrin repeat-containing protein [Tanacetum coccineum]
MHQQNRVGQQLCKELSSTLEKKRDDNHGCISQLLSLNVEVLLSQQQSDPAEEQGKHHSGDTGTSYDSSILPSQELEDSAFPTYIPTRNMYQNDADIYSTLFDQGQNGTSLASESSLTIAQEQKFTIREISPEWVYVTEPSKVLIVGTFTCDPQNNEWICMFGDTEVPVEIIQEGVISCHAPPHTPGKVTICITSGNREACSEVEMFLMTLPHDCTEGEIACIAISSNGSSSLGQSRLNPRLDSL